MELRQLRHFIAVVERGNLSEAAQDALITQPAMSRSIKALEESLQVRLLDRLPRGMAVTEAGQKLFVEAQYILNECERIKQKARAFDSGIQGAVKLGVAPLFSGTIITSVVAHLRDHYPGLTLEVQEGMYPDLIANLRVADIDLAFSIYSDEEDPADFKTEKLYEVSTSIVVGTDHPLASKTQFSPDDFLNERWVTTNQRHSQDEVAYFLAGNQLPPPGKITITNSLFLLRSLVLNNGFICLVASDFFEQELKEGRVKNVQLPFRVPKVPAGIISRRYRIQRKSVDIVMQVIRDTCSAVALDSSDQ